MIPEPDPESAFGGSVPPTKTCPRCGESIRTVTVTWRSGGRREDWTCTRGHLTENAVVQTKHPAKKRMVDA